MVAFDPKQPLAGQGRTTGIRRKAVCSYHSCTLVMQEHRIHGEKQSMLQGKTRPGFPIDTSIHYGVAPPSDSPVLNLSIGLRTAEPPRSRTWV